MKSERIAYLSSEMDLTPDEAAEFWAVYNEAEGARMKSFDKIMETFKELDKAVKDKVSEKELDKCLKAYLEALDASRKIDIEYIDRYKKILPAEKVAKLLLGEEKFRRQQISRLRGGHKKDSGEKKN